LKAIIIAGGELINPRLFYRNYGTDDFVIAADSGYDFLTRIDIKPNLIIGDMDSIQTKLPETDNTIEIIKYPTDKDHSDLELAIKYSKERNFSDIIILGGIGTYIDHSLANILSIAAYSDKNTVIRMITPDITIIPFCDRLVMSGYKGRRFSFFLIKSGDKTVFDGAAYNYKSQPLSIMDFSLSNRIIQDTLEIDLFGGKGVIMVFREDNL